jgi:hypothetical protein
MTAWIPCGLTLTYIAFAACIGFILGGKCEQLRLLEILKPET